jgi:serpin B
MKWKEDLKDNLSEMGMHMTGFPNLIQEAVPIEISEIVHQSFLEVNEDGSEAAAATAVGVGITSAGPPTITLNKSFIFFIRERHTGAILFIGQLVDPAKL